MMNESRVVLNRWFLLSVLVVALVSFAVVYLMAGSGEAGAAFVDPTSTTAGVVSTTSTTVPPTTTTTTVVRDDGPSELETYRLAYDSAYQTGYEAGYDEGMWWDPPERVVELSESDDAAESGIGNGFLAGWAVGTAVAEVDAAYEIVEAAADVTQVPVPTAPKVVDRGYDQGKDDGYVAGLADGKNGTWQANFYVAGQGPKYTDGFYEAYDMWYKQGAAKARARSQTESFNGSIRNISCAISQDCND